MSRRSGSLLSFFALTYAVFPSMGQTFVSPDNASATNTNLAGAAPEHLIDRSGIGAVTVTLDNIGSILHGDSGPQGEKSEVWRGSSNALPITLTFDFDSPRRIDYVGLWQALSLREGTGAFNLRFWDGPGGSGNQIGGTFMEVLDTGAGGDNSILINGRAFDVGLRAAVNSVTMEITSVAHEVFPNVHLGEVMVAALSIPDSGLEAAIERDEDGQTENDLKVIWPTNPGILDFIQKSADLETWTSISARPEQVSESSSQYRFNLQIPRCLRRG